MRAEVRGRVTNRSMATLMAATRAAGCAMVHVDDMNGTSSPEAIDDSAEYTPGVANYVHGYVKTTATDRRATSQALVVVNGRSAPLMPVCSPSVIANWVRSFGMGMLGGRVATP